MNKTIAFVKTMVLQNIGFVYIFLFFDWSILKRFDEK